MLIRIVRTVGYSLKYARLNLVPRSRPMGQPVQHRMGFVTEAVLLVPGFLGTRDVLHPYQTWFHRAGIRAFTFNHGLYSVLSFGHAERLLLRRIREIRRQHPELRRLTFVAHSMGGLMALNIHQDPVLEGLELRLAALGTPYRGTWAALLGAWISPSAFDLLPIHARYRLEEKIRRVRIPFKIFVGEDDVLAPPAQCCHPDAPDPQVFPIDHAGLLLSKRVFAAVHAFVVEPNT